MRMIYQHFDTIARRYGHFIHIDGREILRLPDALNLPRENYRQHIDAIEALLLLSGWDSTVIRYTYGSGDVCQPVAHQD